jgi:HEAT repeat protein
MNPIRLSLRPLLRITFAVLAGWVPVSLAPAQVSGLEDRPYAPSASVVKGTVAALSDPSEEVVALAVRALGDWRQADAAAEVVKLLDAETPKAVRAEAFQFFRRLGPRALPQVAEVVKYTADPDAAVRAAVLGVVLDAKASADHLGAIRPLLDDPRGDVRAAAANCLGQAGKAALEHHKALLDAASSSGSTEVKAAALRALVPIGGFTPADLEAVAPLMNSRDAEVRIAAWSLSVSIAAAVKAGGAVPEEKSTAVRTALRAQFEKEPAEIRVAMVEEVGKDKATTEAIVPYLVRRVRIGLPEVKPVAMRVLGKAGEAALPEVPFILEHAKDADSAMRAAVIAALGSIGPAAVKPNVALIANGLVDPSEGVRTEALLALPACGDAIRNFPFKVSEVYPTASPEVRGTLLKAAPVIVRVLGMSDEVLKRAHAAFADPDPDIRIAMAFVMGQLGAKDGAALLPGLLALVKDADADVRGAAVVALRSFATDAAAKQKLRATLLPLLKDADTDVRWAVLDAFHELDPGQEPAIVTAIAALLKDEDRSVRASAVRALGAAGAVAKPHLLDIIRFFNDDPAVPPYAAAQAVSELSPLTPQEIVSLLHPMYVYSDLLPLTRLTAHNASGGDRDAQILIRLLGRTRITAREAVAAGETAHAITLLEDALKAPLLHTKLKAEIESRLAELKAAR